MQNVGEKIINKVHYRNVEVAYGVLYKVSAMLSQENRFSLISTRKYKKSVHNLNNFPLFTSFSFYIFRK